MTLYIGACLVVLLVTEVAALVRMYRSVSGYQVYWTTRAKQAGDITYIALGDSAAQGIGASHPDKGYVGLLAQRLAHKTNEQVRVINLSKSGAKIADVLRDQLPKIGSTKASLVTIEIGANDIATFNEQQFRSEFTELAKRLPPGTFVTNMPYFGSRPARRPAAFRASQIIAQIIEKDRRLHLVDLQKVTTQHDSLRGYAADFFHPNNRNYIYWADAFWEEIDGEL